ncbi:MAG: trigger factor [Sphingobacteriales bacterium]|jgi:trigger factor
MPTVTRENIGLLIDKITVTVQTEDYLASFEKQLKQFARNANIPGFRKGMVPAGVVKKMHGPALFADEVLRSVEKKLVDYLQGEQLDIFAQPIPSAENSADQLNMNAPSDYSFSFEIGLKPAFDLNLPSVSLPRYKVNVTEEMVNDEIERLQARLGRMSEPEVVDNEENVLNVTFEEEGVENAPKKENSLLVKYFTSAFRSTLMGLKKDSTVTVDLRSAFEEKEREWLIKDLGVDGSDASLDKKYTMTIVKVGLVEKRELNEEFFKEAFPTKEIKTEEEMRQLIREDIQKQWDNHARNLLHHELYHVLLEKTTMDFPESFLKKWMQSGGEKLKSAEEVEKEFPTFKDQLRWTLISDKIVKENNLDVNPEELKEYMRQQILGYFGGMSMDGNIEWLDSYVDRMLKDEQQVESSYRRLITEKLFGWAEHQINAQEKPISSEEFLKLQEQHNHHDH